MLKSSIPLTQSDSNRWNKERTKHEQTGSRHRLILGITLMLMLSVAQIMMAAGDAQGFWAACYNDIISCTEQLPECAGLYCAYENGCAPMPQASWAYNGDTRVSWDYWTYSCSVPQDYVDCMDTAKASIPQYCWY